MKLKLKETPEQVELIKALGSKNPSEQAQAAEAFAAFIAPVAQKVLAQAGTASMIYHDSVYDEDDSPSIPLDLYYDAGVDYVSVWSQGMAGGLPTSHVSGLQEMKIATYRLDSAVSFLKRYARRARLDVVSKAVERMAQEVLLKQERTSSNLLMTALANATNGNAALGAKNRNVFRTAVANRFIMDDLNKLFTKMKRVNASWSGGTPAGARKALTDLLVSPEVVEQIRAMAYNPMNTAAPTGTMDKDSTGIPATDVVRNSVFSQVA